MAELTPDQYRREYLEFNSAWMREYYLHLSGQKDDLEIAPIYDRYADLFTIESIGELEQTLSAIPEEFETERAAVRRLLSFAVEHFLESSVKELTESISRFESTSTIEWMGRQLAFHESAVAVRTERDRDKRRALFGRREELIARSNDLRAERLGGLRAAVGQLGYPDYRTLYEKLRRIDYRALAEESESLLARTESVYVDRLDEALKAELGIGVSEATRYDAVHFLQLTGYDDRFPVNRLLRSYSQTLAGLGIDVEKQRNVNIDAEPRAHKTSRAFCMPVSIPTEIMLVIRPMGGQSDYQAFFHESGHAQHYAWTSPALAPEFKYSGDYALTETYAFLFNHLIMDVGWLESLLGFRKNRAFVRAAILTRLVTIRRYVAKLIYECELHGGQPLVSAASSYSELQSLATKFETGETEFLYDLDEGFYSANYVRAWAFEVGLREFMKTRFGQSWWSSRRAGSFLREIWETGDRYTADEMASQIGLGRISFDPLIDEVNCALR